MRRPASPPSPRRKAGRSGVAGAATSLLALGLLLPGCSSGSAQAVSSDLSPKQVLAKTAEQMASVDQLAFDGTVHSKDLDGHVALRVDRSQDASIAVDMAKLPGGTIRMVIADHRCYLKLPRGFLESLVPAGSAGAQFVVSAMADRWIALDASSSLAQSIPVGALTSDLSIERLSRRIRTDIPASSRVGSARDLHGVSALPVTMSDGTAYVATSDARLVEIEGPKLGNLMVSYPMGRRIAAPAGAESLEQILGPAAAAREAATQA